MYLACGVCVCACVWYFLLEKEQSLQKPSDDSLPLCSGACNENQRCASLLRRHIKLCTYLHISLKWQIILTRQLVRRTHCVNVS